MQGSSLRHALARTQRANKQQPSAAAVAFQRASSANGVLQTAWALARDFPEV